MTFLKTHLHTILLIALGVFIALTIKSCTDKVQKTEKMVRDEERIKYMEQDRLKDSVAFVQREVFYDSLLKISAQKYDELENKKQPIYNAIKNIRATVPDYTKEQLRIAIANY